MATDEVPTVTTDAGLRTGFRFSPHVIVFGLTFVAMFYAAQGAVVAFGHAWWNDSSRQVVFVLDEWRPNDGYPYITGTLADGSEAPFGLDGAVVDGKRVMKEVPSVAYERGSRIRGWWSDSAPSFSYHGASTNAIPVAAMASLPGFGPVLGWGVLTRVAAVAGFALTGWVATRFARSG